ncbi:MAG: hypothetical protein WCY09_10355 [Candidatus Omnitrophota bacterium]
MQYKIWSWVNFLNPLLLCLALESLDLLLALLGLLLALLVVKSEILLASPAIAG